MKELNEIQTTLVALKSEYNSFGKYAYRTAEGILAALKPILLRLKCVVIVSDEIVIIGDRYFLKSTSTLKNEKGESESAIAYAEIPTEKKGMDLSQITGSVGSYCKKYSLSNLFAIDSCTDTDAVDKIRAENTPVEDAVKEMEDAVDMDAVTAIWKKYKGKYAKSKQFIDAAAKRKGELNEKK